MKNYQIVSDSRLVLPAPVYNQCLWIIKDMDRLMHVANSHILLPEVETARQRLIAIDRALESIPSEYRTGVIESIKTNGRAADDIASASTWRHWKQKFIYALARNLCLY